MKTTFFSVADIQTLIRHVGLDTLMDKMIAQLTLALQRYDADKTVTPARSGFQYSSPVSGLLEWMPIMEKGGEAVIKIVGYHPANPETLKLPTILSTLSTYDTENGLMTAIVDGTFLTALRTGAASAVASRILAAPDSHALGLIGCGAQAVTQLHALSRVFKLQTVYLFDINQSVADSFVQRVQQLGLQYIDFQQVDLQTLQENSDIICTATSVEIGLGPVLTDIGLRPWLHINAIGSDFPGKVELPKTLLERSYVCPDFRDQALLEGECQQLQVQHIGADLSELVQQAQCIGKQQQLSVFDSTGWALEDQVAMQIFTRYAGELGLGVELELQAIPDDPLNPYQLYAESPILNFKPVIRTGTS